MNDKAGSLRDELKLTTQSLHKWVEGAERLAFLKSHRISEAEYHQLIARLHAFFQQLEPLIAHYKQDFINNGLSDIERRLQRTSWLEGDLNGIKQPIFDSNKPPFKTLDSFSGAAGALYVCEGSTLGGLIIKPQLHKLLGEQLPCRFYRGYDDATMPMWRDFTRWLDNVGIDRQAVLLAASETFIRLRGCLDA